MFWHNRIVSQLITKFSFIILPPHTNQLNIISDYADSHFCHFLILQSVMLLYIFHSNIAFHHFFAISLSNTSSSSNTNFMVASNFNLYETEEKESEGVKTVNISQTIYWAVSSFWFWKVWKAYAQVWMGDFIWMLILLSQLVTSFVTRDGTIFFLSSCGIHIPFSAWPRY